MENTIVAHTDENDNVTTVEIFYPNAVYVEKAIVQNNRGAFKTISIVLNVAVDVLEDDIITEIRQINNNAEVRANRFIRPQP